MHRIICENRFCIYWDRNYCALEHVELDNSGLCQSAICVEPSEDYLRKKRKELREKIKKSEQD